MPEKNNAPKKKTKTAAPSRAVKAPATKIPTTKAKAVKPETVYYLSAPELTVIVSDQKSAGSRQLATFDAARQAAIDALLDAIEDAETRLLALKRAKTFAELRDAGRA
jgi:hypothetical protein